LSSITACNPATSGSSGSETCTIRVSRIASADSSLRATRVPVLAAHPSVKIR
jgi:hypothetical protein